MKNTLALITLAIVLSAPFLYIRGSVMKIIPAGKKTSVKEKESSAYDALTFLSAMAAFPNKDIPRDGYSKAWALHRTILEQSKNNTIRNAWQTIGPDNVGGRTVSIAIDPSDTSVIWLGSAGGGLWKSINGGNGINAWTYIATGFPVLGVGAIAINPLNHDEMFIGTGETYSYGNSGLGLTDRVTRGSFGIGILKSTDGGQSWTMSLDWTYQQNRGVWDIQYNVLNPSIIYAATTEGVYKSSDGGTTWFNVLNKLMVMDLEVDPVDTNVIYAGVGNEGSADPGIYKSIDGGASWNLLAGNGLPSAYTNDGRITISIYPGNHNIVMALIANEFSTMGIYRSENAGVTWILKSAQDIVTYQGWYAKGLLMKSDDAAKVLAAGVDLYESDFSGTSFFQHNFAVHSDIHGIVSNPLDANKIYVITDGGLFRSNNFAGSFYDCNDGYVSSQHYIGSISTTDPNLVLSGLQDNNTLRYTGSIYWEAIIGGDGSYNAIDPNNENIQYASYQYLNVYKTLDQWNSSFDQIYYSPSFPEGGNPAAFLAPFILSPSNTQVLYAGNTTLLKTTNAFNFFNVQSDPVDNGNYVLSIAVSATNDDTVYFGTAPTTDFPMHVYRSNDGGNTKTDISAGLPNRYPRRIAVNPVNSSEVYVVFSGFGTGHIFKSENAGASWTDISTSLPDLPFHCLAIDPLQPKNIYAGCDFTVYASVDGGQTWSAFAQALPEAVMVFDLVISSSDRTLYAFTHGHGVYKTDLLDVGAGVPDEASIKQVVIYPNPATTDIFIQCGDIGKESFNIHLYDLNGKLILAQANEGADQNVIHLKIAQVAAGSYLLVVEGTSFRETKKVVIL